MIKIPLPKILFLDIETVGLTKDYDHCKKEYPKIAEQFDKYFDWFLKRFPEDQLIGKNVILKNKHSTTIMNNTC